MDSQVLRYRNVSSKWPLRPNFYYWFPKFSDLELTRRFPALPFEEATLLTPVNIYNLCRVSKPALFAFKTYLRLSFREKARKLALVLRRIGISHKTCEIFCKLPRERFLRPELSSLAYLNSSLPFEAGSWNSMPGLVALMIDSLPSQKPSSLIEVGIGSGYHAACLSMLFDQQVPLVGFEINPQYAAFGQETLKALGFSSIRIYAETASDARTGGVADWVICTAALSDISYAGIRQLFKKCSFFQAPRPLSLLEYNSLLAADIRNFNTKSFSAYVAAPDNVVVCNIEGHHEQIVSYNTQFVPYREENNLYQTEKLSAELAWIIHNFADGTDSIKWLS